MLSFQVSQFRRLRHSLVRDILQACSTFSDRVIYGFRNGRYAEHVFTYGAMHNYIMSAGDFKKSCFIDSSCLIDQFTCECVVT